jgi:hypothetical protein
MAGQKFVEEASEGRGAFATVGAVSLLLCVVMGVEDRLMTEGLEVGGGRLVLMSVSTRHIRA